MEWLLSPWVNTWPKAASRGRTHSAANYSNPFFAGDNFGVTGMSKLKTSSRFPSDSYNWMAASSLGSASETTAKVNLIPIRPVSCRKLMPTINIAMAIDGRRLQGLKVIEFGYTKFGYPIQDH